MLEPAQHVGRRAAAGRELEIVEAELVDGGGALVDELGQRPRRGDRVESGGHAEADPADIHPDAGDLLLLAYHQRLHRPLHHHGDVGMLGRSPPARIEDGAEQEQLRAGEAVAYLDPALRHVRDQPRLGGADRERRREQHKQGARDAHSTCKV